MHHAEHLPQNEPDSESDGDKGIEMKFSAEFGERRMSGAAGPSILSMWQERRDKIQKPGQRERMSPEEIAGKEGVDLDKLDSWLHKRAAGFADEMKDAIGYPDRKCLPLIEEIYNLYAYSKDNPEALQKYPWLKNLQSFEDFCREYCPEANPHSKAFMARHIQFFTDFVLHPSRERLNFGGDEYNDIYKADGEWVLMPDSDYFGAEHLAEKSVIREIIDLIKHGYRAPDYSHQTGSGALEGIASQKAILSARDALKAKVKINTGEYTSYVSGDMPQSGGREGLSSVYAARGGPGGGYNIIRWFDEYNVSFGINKERQEEFLKSTDFRYKLLNGSESLSRDFGSEGILIGNKVPLSAVDTVYYWKEYYGEIKDWVSENCPQATLVSIEAASTLRNCGNTVNRMALQEKISPEQAWEKLLEKQKV